MSSASSGLYRDDASCLQATSEQEADTAAVLLADVRAAPGMEGSPVTDAGGQLLGVLTLPLSHRHFHAEVQLCSGAVGRQLTAARHTRHCIQSAHGCSVWPSCALDSTAIADA